MAIHSFIHGVSLCVFTYCVLFLEDFNLGGIILVALFGTGLLVFIPHFFIVQLIWKNLIATKSRATRLFFVLGIVPCLLFAAMVGREYKSAVQHIQQFEASNYETLEQTFFTEKILGMHFIYHTRICEFDGWRPPKHEPLLVIGMWLNGREDPLDVSLERRIELYKKFFPNNKIKFDCSCALGYSENYHNDGRLK